ncbi:hypothetical protein QCN29_32945 [Streptomyces sp. HNM0663]|uniref:Uncharacterized protein n=1 Tax=Streptomyces chengmaiensis TaxID=3040919 RepID=A0ABT6HYK6_9ACTN|nr:hypothetical protein [Streptomyces chengmaiensis]MDH2393490.1 hypothetical protein [Streptomyces chengmaiensis]
MTVQRLIRPDDGSRPGAVQESTPAALLDDTGGRPRTLCGGGSAAEAIFTHRV